VERFAERDTDAEDVFAAALGRLAGNVVADKMLEMMQRKAGAAECIYEKCNKDQESFTPRNARPGDDKTRRRGLCRRGGFGSGRRGGGLEYICENIEVAEIVLNALISDFGDTLLVGPL